MATSVVSDLPSHALNVSPSVSPLPDDLPMNRLQSTLEDSGALMGSESTQKHSRILGASVDIARQRLPRDSSRLSELVLLFPWRYTI